MVNIPDGLKYAETHEWVKVEGDIAIIGVSDHAQDQLGEIVFAELPEVGDKATAGEVIVNLESAKAVGEVHAPISGEIIEINEALDDEPEKVNSNCYDEGFLYKCKIADASEIDKLLDAAAYKGKL